MVLISLTVLALPACKRLTSSNCSKPQLYAQAQSLPPLRIPAGLDAPNTRGALKIPELNVPEQPRLKSDPCLDEPPRYSPNAKLEPPPKAKLSRKERRAEAAAAKAREKAPPEAAAPPAPPAQ